MGCCCSSEATADCIQVRHHGPISPQIEKHVTLVVRRSPTKSPGKKDCGFPVGVPSLDHISSPGGALSIRKPVHHIEVALPIDTSTVSSAVDKTTHSHPTITKTASSHDDAEQHVDPPRKMIASENEVQSTIPEFSSPASFSREPGTPSAIFSGLDSSMNGNVSEEVFIGSKGCGFSICRTPVGTENGRGGASISGRMPSKGERVADEANEVLTPSRLTCKGITKTKDGRPCKNPVIDGGSQYCRHHTGQATQIEAQNLAAAETERRSARASEKVAGAVRAAALAAVRKVPVFQRIRGVEDIRLLQSKLTELVRDSSLSNRRRELHRVLGDGAYYTRYRALRGAVLLDDSSSVSDTTMGFQAPWKEGKVVGEHLLEVDHTLECQILGHAIVQTEAFSDGGWLQAVDLDASRTAQQSKVVISGLEHLFRIQNCVEDPTLFNLRLMDKSLNITKGGVIKNWLDGRYAGGEASFLTGLRAGFRKSTAVRSHLISEEEGDDLAVTLHSALSRVESPYLERLEAAGECPHSLASNLNERRAHKDRFSGLRDTIHSLIDELECID